MTLRVEELDNEKKNLKASDHKVDELSNRIKTLQSEMESLELKNENRQEVIKAASRALLNSFYDSAETILLHIVKELTEK